MSREELIQSIIECLYKSQRPGLNAPWKEYGLSHAQVGMLYLLYHHDGASVKETAEHLGVTKSAVTQLLDPLVTQGFVDRVDDAKDRRIVRLNLTDKGAALLKKLAKQKLAGLRSAIESLTDPELKTLYRLHKKMASGL